MLQKCIHAPVCGESALGNEDNGSPCRPRPETLFLLISSHVQGRSGKHSAVVSSARWKSRTAIFFSVQTAFFNLLWCL